MNEAERLGELVNLCILHGHPEYCETINKCLAEGDPEFMAMLEGPPGINCLNKE